MLFQHIQSLLLDLNFCLFSTESNQLRSVPGWTAA